MRKIHPFLSLLFSPQSELNEPWPETPHLAFLLPSTKQRARRNASPTILIVSSQPLPPPKRFGLTAHSPRQHRATFLPQPEPPLSSPSLTPTSRACPTNLLPRVSATTARTQLKISHGLLHYNATVMGRKKLLGEEKVSRWHGTSG